MKEDIDIDTLKDELEYSQKPSKEYRCESCCKHYSNRQSLYVHRKKCSLNDESRSVHNDGNELSVLEQLELLKKEVEMLRKNQSTPSVSNTNNGTVNNITINMLNKDSDVQLNDFGKENIDHLNSEFMKTCLLKTFDGVKDYVNEVHFNPQVPENHNVRFKSAKRMTLEVFKDNIWWEENHASILDSMIRSGYKVLFKFFLQNLHSDAEFQKYQEQIHSWLSKISTLSGLEYFRLRNDICYIVKNKTLYALTK